MNKIKLNRFSEKIISESQMDELNGGETVKFCGCSCYYEHRGGSSIVSNRKANDAGSPKGLSSPKGKYKQFTLETDGKAPIEES
ncbi:rSAM-modified peptide [Marinilabiliaceae bacterium JC040]|nr:rSAM-modified peptide [Marinilabiliaceae bacterium JC040]